MLGELLLEYSQSLRGIGTYAFLGLGDQRLSFFVGLGAESRFELEAGAFGQCSRLLFERQHAPLELQFSILRRARILCLIGELPRQRLDLRPQSVPSTCLGFGDRTAEASFVLGVQTRLKQLAQLSGQRLGKGNVVAAAGTIEDGVGHGFFDRLVPKAAKRTAAGGKVKR